MRLNNAVPGVEDLLAQLDDGALLELLEARPDATTAPQPRNLAELAERLDSVGGVVSVLRGLPLPASQLIQAVLALGAGLTPDQFGRRIDHDFSGAAGRWWDLLRAHGLVWTDAESRLQTLRCAPLVFPNPLGLGPRLIDVLPAQNLDAMRHALRELGVSKPLTRRDDVVAELATQLSSPAVVQAVAARAPAEILEELHRWAGELAAYGALPFGYGDEPEDWNDRDDWGVDDPNSSGVGSRSMFADSPYPRLRVAGDTGADAERVLAARQAFLRRKDADRWALDHGLAWQAGWNAPAVLPAEIVVALRGDALIVPFDVDRPAVSTAPLSAPPDAFGAVLSATAGLAVTVFGRLARAPLPGLKSGGVGVRELKRLHTELRADARSIRLVLELLASVDVIESVSSTWATSADGAAWRASDPAERALQLLEAWLDFVGAPTQQIDLDGKIVAALAGPRCAGCAAARSALLDALETLDDDVRAETASLIGFTLWSRPYVHAAAEPGEAPFARVLDEAHQLGVAYDGALTAVGRALVHGDRDAVLAALRRILPPSSDRVLIGADLTAVVVGTPSAALSLLLDSTADRESTGGATVWRLKPASIRRALDDGHPADTLIERLSAVATGELPQALRFLIGDLARRHGSVRVGDAVSTLRSDDAALLVEIAGDRRLHKLGLRMLAPTVLAANAPTDTVLTTLRAHGYLPMPDEADTAEKPRVDRGAPGQLAGLRRPQPPRPARAEPAAPVNLDQLVHRLRVGVVVDETPRERGMSQFAPGLSMYEVRLIGHAAQNGSRIAIDYQSESGALTHRNISGIELFGDAVYAWCELRSAERWFRLDRIRAVAPADR